MYRIFTSPFAIANPFDWLFTVLALSAFGSRAEMAIGSIALAFQMIVLTLVTNLLFLGLMILLSLIPWGSAMIQPCLGFWSILFGLFVQECLQASEAPRQVWPFPFVVTSKYYPWVLIAIYSLLFGFELSNFVAIGVGYLCTWETVDGRHYCTRTDHCVNRCLWDF